MSTTEVAKENLIKNTFRRSSIHDKGPMRIESHRMPTIFLQMGQSFDEKKLDLWLKKIDVENCGYLELDAYMIICKEFVTNPAVLALVEGTEFLFKQLILPEDFASP